MNMNNFLFDLNKPIYARDIAPGYIIEQVHLVDSIHFPLGKPSGKDITIEVEDDLLEWRSINDVELMQHE